MGKEVVLRKYSLREKTCIYPSYFEGIIEFTVDGQIIFKQGAFLTTNFFDSPQKAQEYLSLTYYPSYLYEWEDDICTSIMQNPQYELKNIYGKSNSASRIWPAFNKHGGGCEVVMTKGELKCPEAKVLKDGGKTDKFTQDSYMSDIIFGFGLVETVYKWFRGKKEFDTVTVKTLGGRILDGLGSVFQWIGSETKVRYAISCAYKEEENEVTHLRFWGYVWKDEGNMRYLNPPEVKDCSFNCSKKNFWLNYDASDQIIKVLNSIHRKMVDCAHNFEKCKQLSVSLPEPNNFECIVG